MRDMCFCGEVATHRARLEGCMNTGEPATVRTVPKCEPCATLAVARWPKAAQVVPLTAPAREGATA